MNRYVLLACYLPYARTLAPLIAAWRHEANPLLIRTYSELHCSPVNFFYGDKNQWRHEKVGATTERRPNDGGYSMRVAGPTGGWEAAAGNRVSLRVVRAGTPITSTPALVKT